MQGFRSSGNSQPQLISGHFVKVKIKKSNLVDCDSFLFLGGLSEGAIVGVVFGVLAGILLLAVIAFFVYKSVEKKKKHKQDQCPQSETEF
jgi:presenilin-like A22 family membrane protease